jgi:hypothetical protein
LDDKPSSKQPAYFSYFGYLFSTALVMTCGLYFQELFQIPSEILTALLLNCKLPVSVTVHNTWMTEMLKHAVFKQQATFSTHQSAEHKAKWI